MNRKHEAERWYLVLATLFITALIVCNLVANKFVEVNLGFKTFVISAGVLPYPITFLITDILSEIYGQQRTRQVVLAGFVASVFALGILYLGHLFPAIPESPVSNAAYDQVFQNSWKVIASSMAAYLAAQLVDVKLFHFWKRVTKGKHLWIRNNFSTMLSQLVDTVLVVGILFVGQLPLGTLGTYIADGWMFKVLMALADTAVIYPVIWYFRKRFQLKPGEELPVDL